MQTRNVPRARGRLVLAVLFALLALNAWTQVVLRVAGAGDDPFPLLTLQIAIGAFGAAAAYGSWRATRWSPVAALGYGLITAAMLIALRPLLDLPLEARRGLWMGAAVVLLFGLASALYLRRAIRA